MENVILAFEILWDQVKFHMCQQFVQYYMVFNIKMKDIRCKAWPVAGCHMAKAPATIMFASVVSSKTFKIVLMLSTLHDIEVKWADILHLYVQAPMAEEVWTKLGPEFDRDSRRMQVIVDAF